MDKSGALLLEVSAYCEVARLLREGGSGMRAEGSREEEDSWEGQLRVLWLKSSRNARVLITSAPLMA